jgi:hypothetical protein
VGLREGRYPSLEEAKMRSRREEPTVEDLATEPDLEPERQREAVEGEKPSEFRYDFSKRMPSMAVRETAVLPWGVEAERGDDYSTAVERLLSRVWFAIYSIGEQRQEIVRLRENTRQVLTRLATA